MNKRSSHWFLLRILFCKYFLKGTRFRTRLQVKSESERENATGAQQLRFTSINHDGDVNDVSIRALPLRKNFSQFYIDSKGREGESWKALKLWCIPLLSEMTVFKSIEDRKCFRISVFFYFSSIFAFSFIYSFVRSSLLSFILSFHWLRHFHLKTTSLAGAFAKAKKRIRGRKNDCYTFKKRFILAIWQYDI